MDTETFPNYALNEGRHSAEPPSKTPGTASRQLITVASWFEALAHQHHERICSLYAPHGVLRSRLGVVRGQNQIRDRFFFFCAMGHLRDRRDWSVTYRIDELETSEDVVVANWKFRWPALGINRVISQSITSRFTIAENGEIHDQWDEFSVLRLSRQLVPQRTLALAIIRLNLAAAVASAESEMRRCLFASIQMTENELMQDT
ncbi:MAG: nuclear transport factor 2 family protein [Betaproteobacteria bacterium]|nr:MAG: nuclear transport factor 2 family protein [Betaproteobacteria bacterium]